jgi:GDP-D-mannose dehydratase
MGHIKIGFKRQLYLCNINKKPTNKFLNNYVKTVFVACYPMVNI